MKITRIETVPVCVPLKKGLMTKTAHGEHVVSAYVIVRVHTDEGLVGLGEATLAARWSGETSRSCVAQIEELLAPALVGRDPTNITSARAVMDRELKLNPFTKASVEMALWDIAGKAAGVPVYQLLGGKVREKVPIKMVVGAFDVDGAKALAERFLAWGVRCLKVKVGLDPDGDVARVKAVRQLGPRHPDRHRRQLRLECDGGTADASPPARVRPAVRRAADRPGDPAAAGVAAARDGDPRHGRRERLHADRRLAAGVARGGRRPQRLPRQARRDRRDDGDRPRRQGLGWRALGSNLELGVGTAAMLHVAVAMPNLLSEVYPPTPSGRCTTRPTC
ncbi:MAG: hypothetical protein U0797_12375 [Gemmataceae bacterium]